MAEAALKSVFGSGGPDLLLRWLTSQDQEGRDADFECTRNEFVAYFLSYLRNQTESILQTNANALQILQHQSTPEKLLSIKKLHTNLEEVPDDDTHDSIAVKGDRKHASESPSKEKPSGSHRKQGRRVKTKLFNENDGHSTFRERHNSQGKMESEDKNMAGNENLVISSTPLKNSLDNFPQLPLTSPVTPSLELSASRNSSRYTSHSDSSKERCDTPRINSRHSNRLASAEKSINFGDYITSATKVGSKKKKSLKNTSNELIELNSKVDLDFSNADMFPAIGAKRRNQSGEKRRIKPTNIDTSTSSSSKSFTMNSFNAESFQQPPTLALEENDAFKQQKFQPKELSKSFETERSMLKQERHKLMEKFNILNTSSNVKICPVTPQIKLLRNDSVEKPQTFIEGDATKVNFKDKLETLAKIYNIFLNNNLVLSLSAEVYFLISIVLSKQNTEDYNVVESKLNEIEDNKVSDFLLRSLHNCSYFAIKTLWMQRNVLEVMLDKQSLKLLGENKRVRGFCPDLAKFLLNLYGLKCEGEMWNGRDENNVVILDSRFANANGVVCFNSETDNVDNFPSVLSFQNFKKQRDMFCEILRWWSESGGQGAGSGLRPRVKSLLSLAAAPANHTHLARLVTAHMMADCVSNSHESKLSKLQRRLTGPAPSPGAADPHRLPRFVGREEFYRDFLAAAESEAFRAHARDAFACELCSLDASCMPGCDERASSADGQVRQEYLSAVKRLRLLGKFLGLLAAAPYRACAPDGTHAAPNERVLQSDVALRNHSQPPIDLHSMLETALEQSRLSITIPWLIQYLAMMDYASLRIKYYNRLLNFLFTIYAKFLKVPEELSENGIKKGTVIFLKLCLGWLFELPHFPQESFYELSFEDEANLRVKKVESNVDSLDLVDESVLSEVCPYLKEFNVLLLTSQPSNELKDVGSTFRHITPVTMSLTTADRAKNKERELQARLEEELLRGQPSSTRRVLELVADRVTSATVKELAGGVLAAARGRCRREALRIVRAWRERGGEKSELLRRLRAMYAARLAEARAEAAERARSASEARAGAALRALLAAGAASRPLEALAARASMTRVMRHLNDNWSSVGVLCKDIEGEMNHLLVLGESYLPPPAPDALARPNLTQPDAEFRANNVSAASLIIDTKELVCQLMDHGEGWDPAELLDRARACCRPDNAFITSTSRRVILQLSVELLVILVSRKPSSVDALLNKFHAFWDECCPHRHRNEPEDDRCEDPVFDPRSFGPDERMPTPVSSEDEETPTPLRIVIATDDLATESPSSKMKELAIASKSDEDVETEKSDVNGSISENGGDLLDLFNRILCPRNIVILSKSRCDGAVVWECMAGVILFLLKNDYMSEDSLTEQCLAVYRQDWPQSVLEHLSACTRAVSSRRVRTGGKLALFLDFLAEFCGDMELGP